MTSITGRSSKHGRGFTLIELILVLAIMGVGLAMVAPSLRGLWRGAELRDTALHIAALTRWARTRAAIDAQVYTLRFEPQQGFYRLETLTAQGSLPVLSEFGRPFTIPDGRRVEVTVAPGGETNNIHFFPNGRTDGMRVLIAADDGEQLELVARSATEDFVLRGEDEAEGLIP